MYMTELNFENIFKMLLDVISICVRY